MSSGASSYSYTLPYIHTYTHTKLTHPFIPCPQGPLSAPRSGVGMVPQNTNTQRRGPPSIVSLICMYARTICMCVRMCVLMYAHATPKTAPDRELYIHTYIHMYMYIYIYAFMYICMYACMYVLFVPPAMHTAISYLTIHSYQLPNHTQLLVTQPYIVISYATIHSYQLRNHTQLLVT
jgi:hypothetical protein